MSFAQVLAEYPFLVPYCFGKLVDVRVSRVSVEMLNIKCLDDVSPGEHTQDTMVFLDAQGNQVGLRGHVRRMCFTYDTALRRDPSDDGERPWKAFLQLDPADRQKVVFIVNSHHVWVKDEEDENPSAGFETTRLTLYKAPVDQTIKDYVERNRSRLKE